MRRVLAVFGVAVSAALIWAFWGDEPDGSIVEIPTPGFARVLFIPDAEAHSTTAHVIFPYGEAANPYAEGLAHYVEHLAWLSAFHDASKARHANAWTNPHTTGFWAKVGQAGLASTLADLTQLGRDLEIEPEFALEERNIVQREYDYRLGDAPFADVEKEINRSLYQGSPLARSVIGDRSAIAQFSLEDARRLHRESHRLSDATLLIRGNLSTQQVKKALQSLNLPKSPARPRKPHLTTITPAQDVRDISVPGGIAPTLIYRKLVQVPGCAGLVCDETLVLARRSLDSAMPGGIAGPLRFDAFIARSFSFDLHRVADGIVKIGFWAEPDTGITLDQLLIAYENTLATPIRAGIPAETFDRVKSRSEGGLDRIDNAADYHFGLALDQLAKNRPVHTLEQKKHALAEIQLEDVNDLLKTLGQEGRVVVRKAQPMGE